MKRSIQARAPDITSTKSLYVQACYKNSCNVKLLEERRKTKEKETEEREKTQISSSFIKSFENNLSKGIHILTMLQYYERGSVWSVSYTAAALKSVLPETKLIYSL